MSCPNKESVGGFNFYNEEISEIFNIPCGFQIGFPTLYGINVMGTKPVKDDHRFYNHTLRLVIIKENKYGKIDFVTQDVLKRMGFRTDIKNIFVDDEVGYSVDVTPTEFAKIVDFVSKLDIH